MLIHDLARHVAAQEKSAHKNFADGVVSLDEAAGAAQFVRRGCGTDRLQVGDRFREILEVPALALGVVGMTQACCPSRPRSVGVPTWSGRRSGSREYP